MVTGRTAHPGEQCSRCPVPTPAVSVFMIDGRTYGNACERHVIEVHGMAEAAAEPETYVRGTKTGRVNCTHVPVGARILVRRKMDTPVMLADTKMGSLVATVLSKRKGGGFRCYILTTDLGDIVAPAAMAMHTVPTT